MVKVGTIVSGFINKWNVELFIVASVGEYCLLISTQPPPDGCDIYITILADKIKYNCFKLDDIADESFGWNIDIENYDKRRENENKFIEKYMNN